MLEAAMRTRHAQKKGGDVAQSIIDKLTHPKIKYRNPITVKGVPPGITRQRSKTSHGSVCKRRANRLTNGTRTDGGDIGPTRSGNPPQIYFWHSTHADPNLVN